MRIALLADIHANLPALEACLSHSKAQGAEAFAFLGDLVGYGTEPAEVVHRIMDMERDGAVVIQGNHDALAVRPPDQVRTLADSTAAWTHAQLNDDQRRFLDRLPLIARMDRALLVHATADNPEAWHYADSPVVAGASLEAAKNDPEVRYVFGGHVHRQTLFYQGTDARLIAFSPTPGVPVPVPGHRYWLATVGSVGQPREGDSRAMYALFDARRSSLTFYRVGYDRRITAGKSSGRN